MAPVQEGKWDEILQKLKALQACIFTKACLLFCALEGFEGLGFRV